ncbi:MAG TPA: helix-turn-helix domain-containing protein [Candidatus Acidoferrales bacterium]
MIATAIEKDLLALDGISAPKVITSDAQNGRYIHALLELERKDHVSAAEKQFAALLTLLVEAYEEKHYPVRDASPIAVLTELMNANEMRQKDLAAVFGTESIVSEVLSGKRELNKTHIERLSKKFNVSPAVFF